MPELPEVETMVRGVRDHLVGCQIIDLREPDCACRPISMRPDFSTIRQTVLGTHVVSVNRRAKRVVLALDNGFAFVIEPRMTGLMVIQDPPDHDHLRLEWVLCPRRKKRTHSVWFWDRRGLGTVRLLDAAESEHLLGENFLGPDALDFTPQLWKQRLSATSRQIKVALLDQKLVAGIGNLYASEILHRAGIHPETVASRIRSKRLARLNDATHEILKQAIQYEGSTLNDGTYRNALNQNGGYQNMHRVYGKQGAVCPTCERGTIRRIVQAQRSTFYCPRCQR